MISFENQDLIKKHQTLVNLTQTDLASKDDFHTACSSLALIQESYSLRTEDISEGKIRFEDKVFESHYKFGSKDKFSISVAAWNRGWMDSSIEWLQTALQDVTDKDELKLVKEKNVLVKQHKTVPFYQFDTENPKLSLKHFQGN